MINLKATNAARRRFDAKCIKDLYESGQNQFRYYNDESGNLWIYNGGVCVRYLELDYLLDFRKIKKSEAIADVILKAKALENTFLRQEMTFARKKNLIGQTWFAQISDGVRDFSVREEFYKIFGSKFDFYICESLNCVAVYSDDEMVGFILKEREAEE